VVGQLLDAGRVVQHLDIDAQTVNVLQAKTHIVHLA